MSTTRRLDGAAGVHDAPSPKEQTLGYLLWDATRHFTREFARRIARHGLNFGQFPFMRELWEEDGLTQRELAERAGMRGPTVVAAIQWLESHGMVRRERSAHDRRKTHIFLTPKGRDIFRKVVPEIQFINDTLTHEFSAAERAELHVLLGKLRDNIRDSGLA